MRDDNRRYPVASAAAAPPPPAAPPFHWIREPWGHLLRCGPLDVLAQHGFTSTQLELPAQAPLVQARAAWAEVAASLGVEPSRVLRVRQVHGRDVRVVRRGEDVAALGGEVPDGDAVVTDVPGVAVGVMVADCVPVLLADRRGRAVGAAHAGWRGTCAGIVTATVEALAVCGVAPADLTAAIGPSIGPDDYEVGGAVREAFEAAGHHAADLDAWFADFPGRDTLRLDLWRANRDQLIAAGVPAGAVHVAGMSTPRHPGWLASYRRDQAAAGRMIAMIAAPG